MESGLSFLSAIRKVVSSRHQLWKCLWIIVGRFVHGALTRLSRGSSNWILHRKLKYMYSIWCFRDVILKRDLSNNRIQFSWTTLYNILTHMHTVSFKSLFPRLLSDRWDSSGVAEFTETFEANFWRPFYLHIFSAPLLFYHISCSPEHYIITHILY